MSCHVMSLCHYRRCGLRHVRSRTARCWSAHFATNEQIGYGKFGPVSDRASRFLTGPAGFSSSGPHPSRYSKTAGVFTGGKWAGREADYSYPSADKKGSVRLGQGIRFIIVFGCSVIIVFGCVGLLLCLGVFGYYCVWGVFGYYCVFRQKCGENQNTLLCSIIFLFLESRVVSQIRWKNIAESSRPQMTIWHMRIACCIPKATNKHSQYVIFIAFTQQQLHWRALMLRLEHSAGFCFFIL